MTGSPVDSGTVLVTGGTGSFGSTMVRRLLDTDVAEIRILSRDELKQHDMRTAINDPRLRFYIGDVRDRASVDRAMRGVDLVFHAAALKQVPSCEFFPMEAVADQRRRERQRHRVGRRQRSPLRGLPRHRQGGLPGERHGHDQGADGEDGAGLRAQQPAVLDRRLHGALRQRDDVARVGDPAVCGAGSQPTVP